MLLAGCCILLQLLTHILPKGVLKEEPFAIKVPGDAAAELRHHPAWQKFAWVRGCREQSWQLKQTQGRTANRFSTVNPHGS